MNYIVITCIKHVLKGDNKSSVGMLVFSENALYNSKIKKPFWFWQTEPEMFEVVKFSIKLPDSMIVKDNSSEISKTLYCTPMQSNTPYHVSNFAKNYLYTVLYCNGNMGNVSIDIFDTFFNAKTNGPQIDSVCFEDKKEVYLDAQKNPHCVKIDLSYIGTRNSKDAKSIGFGEMIVKDGGQNFQFEFYPNLDNVDNDLNGFVASLRKGASEVIKDQAKDIVFGQAISDLADLSAPDMFDLEIGSVVCEADSMFEFLDELQSFTKKFNKMKNGLVLEPDTRMQVRATEEHAEAASTIYDTSNEPQDDQLKKADNTEDNSNVDSKENDSFSFPDIASMDAAAGAVSIYLLENDMSYWKPSIKNSEDFWDVMCFYMSAEEGFYDMEPPRAGENGEYYVFPNSVWVNAGYACFPDFIGNLPEIGGTVWRAVEVDQKSTGVAIADTSSFDMISYKENGDHTIEAVYRYYGWDESIDFKVHMSINDDFDKANDYFTYYYTVESVERMDLQDNDSRESVNNSWKQSYIDYIETDPDIAFNPDWCTCGLIYVDNDEIPELIIEYSNEADGTRIVSYKNENTVSYQFSRTGGIGYIEREGLVQNNIGVMGSLVDEFVFLDDKGFHDYGHGYRYGESQDFTNFTQFIWNDEEVSEEEYMENLNKYNNSRLQRWNSYSEEYQNNNYRPYEMSEYLSNN